MRIVKVRAEEAAIRHQADASGVKVLIGFEGLQTGNLLHETNYSRVLKGVDGLLQKRIEPVHLSRDQLALFYGSLEHHSIGRRKALINLQGELCRQKVVQDGGADPVRSSEFLSEL
jgi:hypothetical protein